MFNLGAFILDPLNISGIQTPQRPSPRGAPASPGQPDPNRSNLHNTAATAQPGMTYPGLQPDLDLSLQPPPGVAPAGNADGRPGFLQGLMGGSNPMQHAYSRGAAAPLPPSGWVYQQGKGPVWQSHERTPQGDTKPVFNPTFTGNRF